MDSTNNGKEVSIPLKKEEAMVLFDWLRRVNESKNPQLFEDQAEERVLWDMEAILEKVLIEPFGDSYQEELDKARSRVRDKNQ